MEVWDLYTKYRECTEMEHIRGKQLPDGCFHLVVHVWIRNREGKYLISSRAADKLIFPMMWECVGGPALKGESSLEAAIREVREELGIGLHPDKGRLLFSKIRGEINGRRFNDFLDVWLFEYDGEVALGNAMTDEVVQSKWLSNDEIERLYDEGKLVETLDYFFYAMEAQDPDYRDIIGKMVSGTIDRPLGSQHPKRKDMIYSVNYGYVENILGGDGEEQDVYLLGIDKPIKHFTGKVIAVYHRFNDAEDKWIVTEDGRNLSDEQIMGDIYFQEQFFYGKLYR